MENYERDTSKIRRRSHLGTRGENRTKIHVEEISKRNMRMGRTHF